MKLNPCPFCGATSAFHRLTVYEERSGEFCAFCLGCYCRGPLSGTKAAAANAWNERDTRCAPLSLRIRHEERPQ
jgi:Lar family restriction alleviation protein